MLWEELKSVLKDWSLGINARKCMHAGVIIVPKVLYGSEALGMKSLERRRVNVIHMKCLRSIVRMLREGGMRNEEQE